MANAVTTDSEVRGFDIVTIILGFMLATYIEIGIVVSWTCWYCITKSIKKVYGFKTSGEAFKKLWKLDTTLHNLMTILDMIFTWPQITISWFTGTFWDIVNACSASFKLEEERNGTKA